MTGTTDRPRISIEISWALVPIGSQIVKRPALEAGKRAYVAAARSAGAALSLSGLLKTDPPPSNQRLAHWAYSLTRVHDSLGIAELDVPWWTYRAVEAVTEWLDDHQTPVRAFEYGSGASTFWLAKRTAHVHSVEHHAGFGAMMASELQAFPNVTLHIVEPTPSAQPAISSNKEGHAHLDFSDYVGVIDSLRQQFDLIVIDGRARQACLFSAREHLAPDGLVVFDNSRRRRYRDAITSCGLTEHRFRGLTPTLPYPEQTSLLSPS